MMNHIYAIILFILFMLKWNFAASQLSTAEQALEYVFQIREETCGAGTGEVLPLQFDVTAWNQYTDPAIRTANLLSKIIEINNGSLDSLTNELFFLMVRNNVHGNSLIFGSAIALEKGLYSKYELFCPYAYKKNGAVRSHDLSVNYNYLNPNTEWYNSVKIKQWNHVDVVTDEIMYRKGDHHLDEVHEYYPIAKLPDGHWTVPYFDCGGGNVWMVTYSSPIFRVENGSVFFRGVATIDIELTYIDINQCDRSQGDESSGLDIFRGTHRCRPTTKCIHEKGKGFVTGAYICNCRRGYFLPNASHYTQAYRGEEIESYFRKFGEIEPGVFECTACAAGCVTCVSDLPCLHYHNTILTSCLLILTVISITAIAGFTIFTYINRRNNVIKSASSTFLGLMCLGGILICSQFFSFYFETSELVCTLRIWPQHIGFFLLYGSLVIKTWRVYKIFTVGVSKRVYLPDKALHKRLVVLMCFTVAILGAWTTSLAPEALPLRTSNNLLFNVCQFGPWEYAVMSVKIFMLLYGVYLCFKIRKVPAQFSDKNITYAIYNAIILGIFITLVSRLFLSVLGPDLSLLFQFLQLQVDATVTLLIIFIPKFRTIRKKKESTQSGTNVISKIAMSTRFNMNRKWSSAVDYNVNFLKYLVDKSDKGTQTKWDKDEDNKTKLQ